MSALPLFPASCEILRALTDDGYSDAYFRWIREMSTFSSKF
jgi:hypothetical protein